MLRPQRFADEIDPGPVQIQARKVHFDLPGIPLEWIPGHPVASTMINLFNVVLPAAEHWFVKTYDEALPLVMGKYDVNGRSDEKISAPPRICWRIIPLFVT